MNSTGEKSLLMVQDLQIVYQHAGGVHDAVRGISFSVKRGQFIAIVGESGSGKSTIARALTGLLAENGFITGGHIFLDGLDLTLIDRKIWRNLRGKNIGFVPQDPLSGLDPLMRIGCQVREAVLSHEKTEKSRAHEKVLASLKNAGLNDPPSVFRAFPHELSGGMKQRALIAAAMINKPAILIADEPTSALDVTVQRTILAGIKKLINESESALLFITHDLGLAAERADYIIVMKDGCIVETGAAFEIWTNPRQEYTKTLIAAAPRIPSHAEITMSPQKKESFKNTPEWIMETEHVTKYYPHGKKPAIEDISIQIPKGGITAVIGGSGSGKTTLASVLLQIQRQSSGIIRYRGENINAYTGRQIGQYHQKVQAVFQNPYESLNPLFTIRKILEEPLIAFRIGGKFERRQMILDVLDQVMLSPAVLNRRTRELSGGQCQRVAIARALITRPELVICDEPVSALDVLIQSQILNLIKDLQKHFGISFLFISHNLGVVHAIADMILVMHNARIIESGLVQDIFFNPKTEYTRLLLDSIPAVGAQYEIAI
ncbi:MAG: ABC transporter ATP-binding protein [Treponema sp.]|jgi:peptide/nickel transport system ATP-binding protein|nr:ABC transporter ATP-binding protein [Treponema sp.]